MELLGKNLLSFKNSFNYYNNILAYDILLQCLNCIKSIHNLGLIHRDIKPSNFCLKKEDEKNIVLNYKNNIYFKNDINVCLIDLGLVKKINLKEENMIESNEMNNRGFVGTLTYASMNAHNKEELTKKDDLWSFFFMLLYLLNEKLPWRNISCENEKEIIEIKQRCINEPEKYLFLTNTRNKKEILNIFDYIKNIGKNENDLDYEYIFNQLSILKNKEIQKIINNFKIKNQILNLQKNLKVKKETVYEEKKQKQYNKISQQDYNIYKLSKASNPSIPSLNSTNYSSNIYYKTNYINCKSENNNENFYQSVLKLGNCHNNKNIINNNISSINNKTYYDCNNNIINIHSYKSHDIKQKKDSPEIGVRDLHTETNIEKPYVMEKKNENDKSLIEFLIGKSKSDNSDINIKDNKKEDKRHIKVKKRKINIHNKRKCIKFQLVKKEK
jgi:serine/threonine protein kinase